MSASKEKRVNLITFVNQNVFSRFRGCHDSVDVHRVEMPNKRYRIPSNEVSICNKSVSNTLIVLFVVSGIAVAAACVFDEGDHFYLSP